MLLPVERATQQHCGGEDEGKTKTSKLRILLCSENVSPQVNGIARRVTQYVHGLRLLGHKVDLLHPNCSGKTWSQPNPWNSKALMMTIRPDYFLDLVLSKNSDLKYDIVHVVLPLNLSGVCMLTIYKILRVLTPDTQAHPAPAPALILSWHCNIEDYIQRHYSSMPILASCLEILVFDFLGSFMPFVSDRILVPTSSTEPRLVPLWSSSSRAGICPTGIALTHFHPDNQITPPGPLWLDRKQRFLKTTKRKYLLLYVGRLSPEKGIEDLLDALTSLNDCALWIIGDGPSRSQLERIVEERRLPVLFLGYLQPQRDNKEDNDRQRQRQLHFVYPAADCFVCPSQTETFGQVIQEAIATGVRVAIPRVPSLVEAYSQVLPDQAFWNPNCMESMLATINRQLSLPPLTSAEKEANRSKLISWNDACQSLLKEYQAAIAEAKKASKTGGGQPRAISMIGLCLWLATTAVLAWAIFIYTHVRQSLLKAYGSELGAEECYTGNVGATEAKNIKTEASLPFEEAAKAMSASDMLFQQLRLFSLKKNVATSWKSQARKTANPIVLLLYVGSSFTYGVAGGVILLRDAALQGLFSVWFPWREFGIYLIWQSFVTLFSDVVYVDQASRWHPADRCSAMFGLCFTLTSGLIMVADQEFISKYLSALLFYLSGILLSAASFAYEWRCKAKGQLTGYLLAHTGWHVFGPVSFVVLLLVTLDPLNLQIGNP